MYSYKTHVIFSAPTVNSYQPHGSFLFWTIYIVWISMRKYLYCNFIPYPILGVNSCLSYLSSLSYFFPAFFIHLSKCHPVLLHILSFFQVSYLKPEHCRHICHKFTVYFIF